jgi:hypothetical protein
MCFGGCNGQQEMWIWYINIGVDEITINLIWGLCRGIHVWVEMTKLGFLCLLVCITLSHKLVTLLLMGIRFNIH